MIVPRTISTYNADCRVVEKHITLEAQQVGAVASCRNNTECAGLLAFYGVVAAASAVVSGSVAVVGNAAYWLEKQGQCNPQANDQKPTEPAMQTSQVQASAVLA
jgi:hypothetical protein